MNTEQSIIETAAQNVLETVDVDAEVDTEAGDLVVATGSPEGAAKLEESLEAFGLEADQKVYRLGRLRSYALRF